MALGYDSSCYRNDTGGDIVELESLVFFRDCCPEGLEGHRQLARKLPELFGRTRSFLSFDGRHSR